MKLILTLVLLIGFFGCSKGKEDAGGPEMTEPAQQLGDVMASIDEVGGTSGLIAALEVSSKRTFVRYAPEELSGNLFSKIFLPQAQAVACNANGGGFVGCVAGAGSSSNTRNFNGCTVGASEDVVFQGQVRFDWAPSTACGLAVNNDTVTRAPNFTVEGRRGATLAVTRDSIYGQRLKVTGTSPKTYTLESDGIRRKFTSPGGVVTFDYITTIHGTVTIEGDVRNGRKMTGTGVIRVRDNLTQVTCDYSPVNVTWGSGSCNCPTQGAFQATCSDGKTASVNLTGCGTAGFTLGDESGNVTFDRCGN